MNSGMFAYWILFVIFHGFDERPSPDMCREDLQHVDNKGLFYEDEIVWSHAKAVHVRRVNLPLWSDLPNNLCSLAKAVFTWT